MTAILIKTSKHIRLYRRFRNILIYILLIVVAYSRRITTFDLIESDNREGTALILLIIVSILIVLIILFFIMSILKRKIGKIFFSPNQIKVEYLNEIKIFDLVTLWSVKLDSGFLKTNKYYIGLTISHDNWVELTDGDEICRYQFYFLSSYDGQNFGKLVEDWKRNIDIKIV